jgi:hypothetical protein
MPGGYRVGRRFVRALRGQCDLRRWWILRLPVGCRAGGNLLCRQRNGIPGKLLRHRLYHRVRRDL